QQDIIKDVSGRLKVSQPDIALRVEKLISELKELEKKKNEVKAQRLQLNLEDILKTAGDFSGIKLIVKLIPDAEEANLRSLVDSIKKRLPHSICLLAGKKEEKAILVMGITADLLEKKDFNAGNLIKDVAREINGSGGGRADFAFGAGDFDKIELGFGRFKDIIKQLTGSERRAGT
ncbi:MAG: DHHA1 domain-containing protein, partial [Candidatus Omnitrophota bacterium]